jgi:hypothetical protein
VILELLRPAMRADAWLKRRLGQPYHYVLGVGLLIGIGQRIETFFRLPYSHGRLGELVLEVLFGLALLLDQMNDLGDRLERRRVRRRGAAEGRQTSRMSRE